MLYAGGLRAVGAGIWRQLTAADPELRLFVPSALADEWFAARLPTRGGAVYDTQPLPRTAAEASPAARRFVRAFKARYGSSPPPAALYGYESMRIVLAAIRSAERAADDEPISREDVVQAFFEAKGRDGVLGRYRIDLNGDTSLTRWGAFRFADGTVRFQRALVDR